MKTYIHIFLLTLFSFQLAMAQNMDPKLISASFSEVTIEEGATSLLSLSFGNRDMIPENSFTVTISPSTNFFIIEENHPPAGVGGAFFTWFPQNGSWIGVNKDIPTRAGGPIEVRIKGVQAVSSPQPILAEINDIALDGNRIDNDVISSDLKVIPRTTTYDCPLLSANVDDDCDDGDADTENDKITADCGCSGTPIVITYDCPLLSANVDDDCDDGDADTENDKITADCGCSGTPIVIVYDCPLLSANVDDDCDDGDADTENDKVTADCGCSGTPIVIVYDCPLLSANVDDDCDDGDADTENDKVTADCGCSGTPIAYDCPVSKLNFGDPCDDGDDTTNGETIQLNCSCGGGIVEGDADPALIAASFSKATIEVGEKSILTLSFSNRGRTAIPVNSISVTISTSDNFYTTDGTTLPEGEGADLFEWFPTDPDNWVGINKVSIPSRTGGPIQIMVMGMNPSAQPALTVADINILNTSVAFDNDLSNDNINTSLKINILCADKGGVGTSCDDGNPCTTGDVIDSDCNCVGSPITTTPTLAGVPDDIAVSCEAIPTPATVTSGSLTVDYEQTRTGDDDCDYTLTRTWTVNDGCGNSASATQMITVVDELAPILAGVPESITVNVNDGESLPDVHVTVTDNCDTEVELHYEKSVIVSDLCSNTITYTEDWAAIDNCNNAVSASRQVTIIDDAYISDADGDGVCDEDDICAGGDDNMDGDGDGIPDYCDSCDGSLAGKACEDGDACTIGDVYDADCNCVSGPLFDDDGDGVCNADDICEGGDDNMDGDGDGIPDHCDSCDGSLAGKACEDGDACTIGDVYDADCNCVSGPLSDDDGDGVCNADDICEGGDDNADEDGDGIPDYCETCDLSIKLITKYDPNCANRNNGSLTVEVTNGKAPYMYEWSNEETGSASITHLVAGEYYVSVTDADGCTKVSETYYLETPEPIIAVETITHATCGEANGAIVLEVSGGVGEYTYIVNGKLSTANPTDLAPGTYIIIIRDQGSCEAVFSYTIENTTSDCGGGDGEIQPTTCDFEVRYGTNSIAYEGNIARVIIFKGYDERENIVYECQGNCPTSKVIGNLPPGNYGVKIFNHNYTCVFDQRYTAREGGSTCTDAGKPCNDGNDCTTGDTYDANCNCIGASVLDSDDDGVCDAIDICEGGDDNIDTDGDGIPDACDTNNCTDAGKPCNDGDDCTIGDVYDADCNCVSGTLADADGDGICDTDDCAPGNANLPAQNANIPCEKDGKSGYYAINTCDCEVESMNGEVLPTDCNIEIIKSSGTITINGPFRRAYISLGYYNDNAIIFECNGDCPDSKVITGLEAGQYTIKVWDINWCVYDNSRLMIEGGGTICTDTGKPCDDGNDCTIGDYYDTNCNCIGGAITDSDGDGVCDADDICAGGDDNMDSDGDGIPDACDTNSCPDIGNSCDDGDSNTGGDVIGADCICAGTPILTGDVCADVLVEGADGEILVSNLDVFFSKVRIFKAKEGAGYVWPQLDGCEGDCSINEVFNMAPGTYVVEIDLFNKHYSPICPPISRRVTVTGSSALDRSIEDFNVKVFPNPAEEEVFINLSDWESRTVDITIQNHLSQVVYESHLEKVDQNLHRVDLKNFTNGIYYIQIGGEGKRPVTKKLMVARMY